MDNLKDKKNTTMPFNIVVFIFIIISYIFKGSLNSIIKPIILSFWMLLTFFFILINGYKEIKRQSLKARS